MELDLMNPTERHCELRQSVRAFAEEHVAPQAAEHDRAERFNVALFRELGKRGLLGVTIPRRFGGAEMDATAAVILYEELSAADPGFTLSCLTHSVLFGHHLACHGNDEQQARFLPDVCAGRILAGLAISESTGGTDVLGMKTTARRDGADYVLNGEKMWITNGVVNDREPGDVFLVYARTSSGGPRGLTLFLVEKGMEGFKVGRSVQGRCGVRASKSAQLLFEECRVPAANRVGEEGAALRSMMQTLEIERLTMAAMSLGIARRSLEIMNDYASRRTAFDKPLREFGQIQRHLAESYAQWLAGRCLVYRTANQLGSAGQLDADAAKLYCSTMAKNVADRAIQVLGAYGYSGEYPLERFWRDAKLFEIGGGTIEAHQKNVTRCLSRMKKLS